VTDLAVTACVDASVIVKLLLYEKKTPSAIDLMLDLLYEPSWIVAPPHLPAEVTNALYKRVRQGDIDPEHAFAALEVYASLSIALLTPSDLGLRAILIAKEFGLRTTYDAMYLALGEILDCPVWTADERFFRVAQSDFPRLQLLDKLG
jgi:predicted nucleic acid-binding protein